MVRKVYIFCFLLIAEAGLAQDFDAGALPGEGPLLPMLRFTAFSLANKYREDASNSDDNITERRTVEIDGYDFTLGVQWAGFEFELDMRQQKPRNVDAWTGRDELYAGFLWYPRFFHYVQPSFGFYQMSQKGDVAEADASPAFIDSNTGMYFGLRTNFMPFGAKGHGLICQGQYRYLTSLEKSRNFGDDSTWGIGYAYASKESAFKAGVLVGRQRNFFNATVVDGDLEENVRHIYTGDVYGVFLEY